MVGALALGLACAGPRTEFRSLPEQASGTPPRGHPIYAAVLPEVTTSFDGEPVEAPPGLTLSYVRYLRRASVFTDVAGPGRGPDPLLARLALATRLVVDPQTGANLSRSVVRGASLGLLRSSVPLQIDLTGEMELRVRLPGTGDERAYVARTEATRFYQDSARYQVELDQLARDVTSANLRSIITQLRADRALTAETAPGEDPLGGGA